MIVRIRGIKRVRAKGHTYFYHRATGQRIRSAPGTPEFLREVEALDGRRPPDVRAGTLRALVVAYRGSPEFANLAARTRADYQKVFDYLAVLDAMPLAIIDEQFALKLRDKAQSARKRRFANYVVQVARLLFAWGRPRGWVEGNPFQGVPLIRRPRGMAPANRPWTEREREALLAAAPPQLVVGIALGMFAMLREGDAVRFPWSAYDGKSVQLVQSKTGEPLWLPAHRRLREILDATPRRSPIAMTTIDGRPFTVDGFRASFFKMVRRLEAEGRVGSGVTFHGLRHTVGALLADDGQDPRTIAAALGQKSVASALHYSEGADRRKRAVVALRTLERKMHGNGKPGRTPAPKR